jgi:hypothetical protein
MVDAVTRFVENKSMNDISVIHTKKGEFAIVDSELFPILNAFEWKRNAKGYFYTYGCRQKPHIFLHRLVNHTPADKLTDHINGFPQDCTRRNLRDADKYENGRNRAKSRGDYMSNFKGVTLMKGKQYKRPWSVRITVKRKCIHVGYFETQELAAAAYNEAAKKYHGEFAQLNQI